MDVSFNFAKSYTDHELRFFIAQNPQEAKKLIEGNLQELAKVKENSKLWFNLKDGTLHIDQASPSGRRFNKWTALSKGYDLAYLKTFQRFAKLYILQLNPDKVQADLLAHELKEAQKGLERLANKDGLKSNKKEILEKLEKAFGKLEKEVEKNSIIKERNTLPFIQSKINLWKTEIEGKGKEEELQRELLHQTYFLLKNQLKDPVRVREDGQIRDLSVKERILEQLPVGEQKLYSRLLNICRPLYANKTKEEKEDIELSLFTEFLIAKGRPKACQKLLRELEKIDKEAPHGVSSDIKVRKRTTIEKSGLFFYTPNILPQSKTYRHPIPLSHQILHYTKGIGKILAGGLGIIVGIVFRPAKGLAAAGYVLAASGIKTLKKGVDRNLVNTVNSTDLQLQLKNLKGAPIKAGEEIVHTALKVIEKANEDKEPAELVGALVRKAIKTKAES